MGDNIDNIHQAMALLATSQDGPPALAMRSQRSIPVGNAGRTESEQLADVISHAQKQGVEASASATKDASFPGSRSGQSGISANMVPGQKQKTRNGDIARDKRQGQSRSPRTHAPANPGTQRATPGGEKVRSTPAEDIAAIYQATYARLHGEQQAAICKLTETMAQLQTSMEALQLRKTHKGEMSNLIGNAVKLEQQYPAAEVVPTPPQAGAHCENLQPTTTLHNERTDVPLPPRRRSPRQGRTRKGHRRHQ